MSAVPPADPASLAPLAALRAATRDHHRSIDALMDLQALADRARYGRVLQAFDAFLPAWEAAAQRALPPRWHGWLARRSRRPFLADDLRVLGLAPAPAARMPALASPAAAWGSVYVMEGSALGGQVITRALAAGGLAPGRGASYFHGWGDGTGAMWREFRELLEAELRPPGALAQACAAACLTFETLSGLLERALHERAAAA